MIETGTIRSKFSESLVLLSLIVYGFCSCIFYCVVISMRQRMRKARSGTKVKALLVLVAMLGQ